MLFNRVHQQWAPDYVIPFKITKEECKKLYIEETKKSIFISGHYRDPQLIDGFRGIYMPYYVYHAKQKGKFTMNGVSKRICTNRFYQITGNNDIELEGYTHDASVSFDDRISERIAPFDTKEQKPFAPGYLSGFYADIGDAKSRDYDDKGVVYMARSTARMIAKDESITHGCGAFPLKVDARAASVPTRIHSVSRAFYPVWFMSYRNKDKITYAAVNGQTGKVYADLPLSPWRILIAVLLLGAVFATLLFFLPSVKANLSLVIAALLLVVGAIVLRIRFNRATSPETGLSEHEEVQEFKKRDKARNILVAILTIAAMILAICDPAFNIISYGGCLICALTLFYLMVCHIRFQIDIAKRRPPQFNKKGAAYDE